MTFNWQGIGAGWAGALAVDHFGPGGEILSIAALIIGVVSGLLWIIVFAVPDLRERLASIEWRREYNWVHVIAEVEKARDRVWVLQTWLPYPRHDRTTWEPLLKTKRLDFRLLLIDEQLVPFRLAYRRDRLEAEQAYRENAIHFKFLIDELKSSAAPGRLTIRRYKCVPFGPIYVIDDNIFWGLYYSHMDALAGPAFRCTTSSKLGTYILQSYEEVWERASLDLTNAAAEAI